MFKRVLLDILWLVLLIISSTIFVQAKSDDFDYTALRDERARILSLPIPEALTELNNSKTIVPDTPLGKYLFNVTKFNIDSSPDDYPLSDEELLELESQHLEFYLEKRIIYLSKKGKYKLDEQIKILQNIVLRAQYHSLKRIERLAKAFIVDIKISQQRYFSAMLLMRSVLTDAPTATKYGVSFDYNLDTLYTDLAKVLFFLGDYESSLLNCERVIELQEQNSPNKVLGQLCQARANLYLERYSDALITLTSTLQDTHRLNLLDYQMFTLFYLIKTYNLMGLYNESLDYASQALELRESSDGLTSDYSFFLVLHEYIKTLINTGDNERARRTLSTMANLTPRNYDLPDNLNNEKLLFSEALVSFAEQDYQLAASKLFELKQLEERQVTEKFSFSELPKFTDELDNRQLIDLKERAERSDILLKISLVIGVVLATWLSRLIWVARKQEHSLAYYTSKGQMDSRTGLLNAEMITRKITQLLKYNGTLTADKQKQYTLAVIQVSGLSEINQTCGYDVGDAILLRVGRAMKTVLSHDDFLVGRLDGLQFLALLNGVTTESCENKLRTIEQLIDYKSVSALPTTLQHSIDISFIIKRVDNSEQVKSAIANGRRQLFKEAASLKDEPDPNERFNPFQV